MDPIEMHQRALATFASMLAQVGDGDLSSPTPCTDWTVGDLIAHVVDGTRSSAVRVGASEPPSPGGEGGDRVAALAAAADRAGAAFSADGARDRTVTLPFGDVPASVFLAIRSGDLYTHGWDLATAIGADTDLDAELGRTV